MLFNDVERKTESPKEKKTQNVSQTNPPWPKIGNPKLTTKTNKSVSWEKPALAYYNIACRGESDLIIICNHNTAVHLMQLAVYFRSWPPFNLFNSFLLVNKRQKCFFLRKGLFTLFFCFLRINDNGFDLEIVWCKVWDFLCLVPGVWGLHCV